MARIATWLIDELIRVPLVVAPVPGSRQLQPQPAGKQLFNAFGHPAPEHTLRLCCMSLMIKQLKCPQIHQHNH